MNAKAADQIYTRGGDGVIAALFMVSLFVPMLAQFFDFDPVEEFNENRVKYHLPELTLNLSAIEGYPAGFERYYEDNFGFRNSLVRAHHVIMLRGFRTPPRRAVVVGKSNWLYMRQAPRRDMSPLPDRNLDVIRSVLEKYQAWFEKQGARFLVIIVPNKHAIYPEYLPWRFQYDPSTSRLNRLLERIAESESELEILDLRAAILAAKRPGEQLYYRAGSHWSDAGERVAYQEVMRKLAAWFPVYENLREPQFTEEVRTHEARMARVMTYPGAFPETSTFSLPIKRRAKITSSTHSYQPHGREVTATLDDSTLPKLVMMHDSFFDYQRLIALLMQESFRESRFIQYRQDGRMAPILERFQEAAIKDSPDIVIVEIVERNIHMIANWPRL